MRLNESSLGDFVVANGGRVKRYCCPLCIDKIGKRDVKYKLYAHACSDGHCSRCRKWGKDLRGSWNCWRCGSWGKLGSQQKRRYNPTGFIAKLVRLGVIREDYGFLSKEESDVKPKDTINITPGLQCYSYLKKRGIEDWQIDYYGMVLGTGKLYNRIIIPDLTQSREWIYWTARDFSGNSPIKYRLPDVDITTKHDKLFNIHRIQSDVVYIAEGVFSAIAIGTDAVALYGKTIFEDQIQLLKDREIKTAICCLDPDAKMENILLARKLSRNDIQPKIVWLPEDKDPSDIGHEGMRHLIQNSQDYSIVMDMKLRLHYGLSV